MNNTPRARPRVNKSFKKCDEMRRWSDELRRAVALRAATDGRMMGSSMRRTGFTLIELLIVMAIIGLLATIAIPRLSNTRGRAQVAAMKTDLRNLVTVQENYFSENQKYTTDPGSDYAPSAGNTRPVINLTRDGWTASITNPTANQTCAVFIGSTPLAPATREGAPECGKTGSTAQLP